jgi:hypothetical protein
MGGGSITFTSNYTMSGFSREVGYWLNIVGDIFSNCYSANRDEHKC